MTELSGELNRGLLCRSRNLADLHRNRVLALSRRNHHRQPLTSAQIKTPHGRTSCGSVTRMYKRLSLLETRHSLEGLDGRHASTDAQPALWPPARYYPMPGHRWRPHAVARCSCSLLHHAYG